MSRTFNAPRDSLLQVMMLVLLFCLGASCDAPASYAQELNKQNLAAKPNAVSALTKKVLDAIRNKDTNLLSALVDPTGIYIGFDTDKINAARFRKELLPKGPAYCVIFDTSCGNPNSSEPDSSLRAHLIRRPITIQVGGVEDFPDEIPVAVKSATTPNEALFTLFFRRVKGGWALQQIEYF